MNGWSPNASLLRPDTRCPHAGCSWAWVVATREMTLCIAAAVVGDNPAGDFGIVGGVAAVDDVAVGIAVVLHDGGIADVPVAVGTDSSDAANGPLAATAGFAAASSSEFDVASRTLPRPRTRLRSDFSLEFTGITLQGLVEKKFIFRNGKILSDKIPHTVQIVF